MKSGKLFFLIYFLLVTTVNAQNVYLSYSRLLNSNQVLKNSQELGLEFGWHLNKYNLSGFCNLSSSDKRRDEIDIYNYTFRTNMISFGLLVDKKFHLGGNFNFQIGAGGEREINNIDYSGVRLGSTQVKSWGILFNFGLLYSIAPEFRIKLFPQYNYRFMFTQLANIENSLNHRRSDILIGIGIGYFFTAN